MAGGGTIDLDWSSLTPDLAERLVGLLNSALSNATRPSFIGPISVSSFDFGTASPDIELVDIRDIYPDFLEDDEDEDDIGLDRDHSAEEREKLLDDFEWVSRKEGAHSDMSDDDLFDSRYLPPHVRRPQESAMSQMKAGPSGARSPSGDLASIHAPSFNTNLPNMPRISSGPPFRGPILPDNQPSSLSRAVSSQHDLRHASPLNVEQCVSNVFPESPSHSLSIAPSPPRSPTTLPPRPPRTEHPDLQLHFHIDFESNLRLMINTSLQINYPSPMIMALPIKLCVIGLVLEGELVVACEGSRKRIHACFLDDELATRGVGPIPASSHRIDDNEGFPSIEETLTPRLLPASGAVPRLTGTPSKPGPAGIRLLPSILLESEIGQEDKHVLRNVARVERFIQDVIRKTLEEELVYPNFQTIVLDSDDQEYML